MCLPRNIAQYLSSKAYLVKILASTVTDSLVYRVVSARHVACYSFVCAVTEEVVLRFDELLNGIAPRRPLHKSFDVVHEPHVLS